MANTEQIVRQVIDLLSEGVSELVLMVVVLREQNAPMPPNLPAQTGAVNETARKLGLIARKLASTDYKDFKEIADEINQAAEALDQAGVVMTKAVAHLGSTPNRMEGWDNLVDACRVMSGKTIRLLQIVYGAPLKRLKINADRLADQMNKMDTHPKGLKDPKAQQKLLDELKPITEKALRLEKHLNDRAKVSESPQTKQSLLEQAAEVHKKAQGMVDAVNDAITKHPDNADLSKPIDELREAVEKGRDLGEKSAPPAPKGLPDAPPRGAAPSTSTGPKTLHEEIEQAKEMAKAIPDVARKDPASFPDAHDRLKDKVDQIRKKVHPSPSPEHWNHDVEQPLAIQLKAGRDVMKAPNNPAAKKALDDATGDVLKSLNDIEPKATPGGQKAAQKPEVAGQKSASPAQVAGQKSVNPSQVAGEKAPIKGKSAQESGDGHGKTPLVDPETKKQLLDKIKDLGPDIAKNIKPEKKAQFERAKLKDNVQALKADVKKQEPQHATQHTKQAALAAKELVKAAKDDIAKDSLMEPEDKKRKEEGISALEAAIPEFVAAVKDVLNDMANPEAGKDLDDKLKKLERAADRAVGKQPPAAQVGKEDWKKAKADMEKAIDAVVKGDKEAVKKALDKAAEQAIKKAAPLHQVRGFQERNPTEIPADNLQKLVDKFSNGVERGDPNVGELIPEIEKAYKQYAAVPHEAAQRLDDAVNAVVDAVNAGDPHPPIADLQDAFDKFVNDTQKDPSPEVRVAGAKAAEEIIPKLVDMIKKAQQASKNPTPQSKQAVNSIAPQIKKPIQEFAKALKVLDDDFNSAKEEMKKDADAVSKGNRPAAKKSVSIALKDKPLGRNWTPQKGRGVVPPTDRDSPSNELQKMWDKLRNAGNRGDPQGINKLEPQIDRALKKVTEPPKQAVENVKKAVDNVLAAANGKTDPVRAAEDLREAVDKLVDVGKSSVSPQIREAVRDSADTIIPLVDDFIRKADDAARHPQDKKKLQDAELLSADVKKPLDNFKSLIKPIDDDIEKSKDDIKKAAQAAQKGDKSALKELLDKIAEQPFGITISPSASELQSEPPLEALEKAWDKIEDAVNRGDPAALERAIPEMEKQYEKVAQQPKQAAEKFKDALDDFADAIRDPIPTPSAPGAPPPPGSRIPDAVRDLQDAFDDFVRDVAEDDPSPEVREEAKRAVEEARPKLEEAIKKAAEAAKAPQDKRKAEEAIAASQQAKKPLDAFKERLKPLDDAFNKNKDEVKKAAEALRKGDKPTAKKAIENIAQKPFGRNFNSGKGRGVPPPEGEGPSDELKKIWDKFKKAADKGDAPLMDQAIPQMEKAFQKVADKPKNAVDKLLKAVDDVSKAAQSGNPNPPINHLKKAVDDFVNDTGSDPSPEVREAGYHAADEMLPAVKDMIKKAEDAAKNPQDKQKAQAVAQAAQQVKKPAEAFKEKLKPMEAAFAKNKEEMKKAAEAVRKGDKPAAKKIIDNIGEKPFGRNFMPGKARGGVVPANPSDGPTDELKNLWNKFKSNAQKGDAPAMKKELPQMEKAFEKVIQAKVAEPKAAADRLERAIDDAVNAVDDHKPIPLKEIKDALDKFHEETKNHPDPQVQYAGHKAVEEFRPEFAELIKKAKDVLDGGPNEKEKVRAFENQVAKAKKPIKNFKVEADPSHADDVLVNDKHGADVKDALSDLKNALDTQLPPNHIEKALDNVKTMMAVYNDATHEMAKNIEDPGKSDYIDRKADELDDLLEKMDKIVPTDYKELQDCVATVPDMIDDIIAHANSDPIDDGIEGAARAANLTAFLDACDEDDLDLGDLLGTATDLADLMRGLIDDTYSASESFGADEAQLTRTSKNAFDLADLLKQIESGYDDGTVESAMAMSEKLRESRSGAETDSGETIKSLAEATTFEDIAAAVAFNIKKQCDEQSENISKTGGNVATELANLANAARGGNKQQMLLSAKAAAAHIAVLSKEIQALAQKIPGKNAQERNIQDHLLRCSQGLQNYGTQLKILTSVKAASIEQSKDTDESLSTIATDLGDLISQALTSMSITNSTILKGK